MERPELICTDIDGTLLGAHSMGIPAINRTALRKAQALGIPIALVSGRGEGGIRPIQQAIGITGPIACYSGALVLDEHGAILQNNPLGKPDALRVVAALRAFPGMSMFLYDERCWYKEHQGPWETFEEKVSCPGVMAPTIEEAVALSKEPYKVLAMTSDERLMARVAEAMKQRFGTSLEITRSSPTNLEIQRQGTTKGTAVRTLCAYCHADPAKTAVFGDYDNDVPMYDVAGISVAMGNAVPEVKARAKYVTESNVDGGLGKMVERMLAS